MILFLGLLAMTSRNAVDPDLWWHLRTGELIVQSGHIPHTDPFSFTRAGQSWISHEWLSEVIFYELWKWTGAGGLIIFSGLITTTGFMLLYLRCAAKPAGAAAAVVLGALAAAPAWGVRPQMFTFALASVTLWLLDKGENRPLYLFAMLPTFLLWLNLHAGFALGPALLLLWAAGLLWEAASGESAWATVRPYLFRILAVFLVCMALVPLNPSGAHLYRYPFEVLQSSVMRSFILEWFPPDFHQLRYVPMMLIWLALLVALADARSRPKARVLAPLLMTLIAAIDAVRHIPILVLLAGPVLAGALPVSSTAKEVGPSRAQFPLLFRGAVLVLMAVFTATRWDSLVRKQSKTEAEAFPFQAVSFLHAHPSPGPLFAYYDWGGYAIWKLYPDYRVIVDGRADLYGDDLLHRFQQVVQVKAGWRQVLDSWGVKSILIPTSSPLRHALALDSGWHLEHEDAMAVVYERGSR